MQDAVSCSDKCMPPSFYVFQHWRSPPVWALFYVLSTEMPASPLLNVTCSPIPFLGVLLPNEDLKLFLAIKCGWTSYCLSHGKLQLSHGLFHLWSVNCNIIKRRNTINFILCIYFILFIYFKTGFYYAVLFLITFVGHGRMTNKLLTCIPYRVLSWRLDGKEACTSGSQDPLIEGSLQSKLVSGPSECLTSKS